jgi:hypothetical protein
MRQVEATYAHVYLIGAPISRAQSRSGANRDTLNMQYAQIAAGIIERCAVYSSGAFRYSSAMVEALATPASL